MNRILNYAKKLLPLLFFVYLFGLLMNFALNDPDIWWHLKTGDIIIDKLEFPGNQDEDPFSYTIPRTLGQSTRAGMKTQWLGQVIFALSYRIGGLAGVVVFRNILIVLSMLILYLWLVKKGLNQWVALFVIAFPSFLLGLNLFYSFERPQGLSFVLVLAVVILLENLRHPKTNMIPPEGSGASGYKLSLPLITRDLSLSYWLLPLVMLVWSNMHAGFVIGGIIICIYIFIEALGMAVRKIKSGLRGMEPSIEASQANLHGFRFILVGVVSIAASFVNPNSYTIFWNYASGMFSKFSGEVARYIQTGDRAGAGWVEDVVLEYKSLWYFYKFLGYNWLLVYWIFIGMLAVFLIIKYWQKRKIDVPELLTVSFIAFFGNYYARGLMFSLTVLPFFLGKTILEFPDINKMQRNILNGMIALVFALFLGFGIFTYKTSPYLLKPGVSPMWVSPWYPGQLTEFLKVTKLPGPMYNFYTWGGFLIFKLYPDYKVFIDGRAFDDQVNKIADGILKAYPGWELQLDAYGVNFIVIPVIFRESGHIIPLATALVGNNKWKLIYLRYNSAIFIRDIPKNKEFIFRFNRIKEGIYEEIVQVENILISGFPSNPTYNISKADALFALGYYNEAKEIYERFPGDSGHRLETLRKMGY